MTDNKDQNKDRKKEQNDITGKGDATMTDNEHTIKEIIDAQGSTVAPVTAVDGAEVASRMEAYAFLSSIFLTLPDKAFVDSLLALDADQDTSDGVRLIVSYAQAHKDDDIDDILTDLGRDRATLVRGMRNDKYRPPYESLYVKSKANMSVGSLNRFYGDVGYKVSSEAKDSPDQIGVEFAFVQLLAENELEMLRAERNEEACQLEEVYRHFMAQHLGRWASEFAQAMYERAETDFYRGVALLIMEVL